MSPTEFADGLRAYCGATLGSVSSYGRTVKHNIAVDGHPFSYHLVWLAADVVYDSEIPLGFREQMAKKFGLEVIAEVDHDHLEPLPGGN